nr:serine/threonine-protein kinase [Nannocystis sp.]
MQGDGKVRRVAVIGHGGMADVHLAMVRGPGDFSKLVVLKELRPGLAQDPEMRAMFQQEARVAARMSHPNIVHTHEVGCVGGRPFIAMEYLDGQPMQRIVRRVRRDTGTGLPLALHLRVLVDVLAGLQHAHELRDYDGRPLGLVHRDVTPHNVIVTDEGQVKLIDFGIARGIESCADTQVGTFKGKASYCAPEQARGERVDRRADLFAVGVMLWEALMQRRMWPELDEVAIVQRLRAGEVPPLPDGAHAELRAVCRRALAIDPGDRPATAAELAEAIVQHGPPRASRRELAALLGRHFADERAGLRALIEAQLRAPGERDADAPIVDMALLTGSDSHVVGGAVHPDEPTRRDGVGGRITEPTPEARAEEATESSAGRPRPRARWRAAAAVIGIAAAIGVGAAGSRWLEGQGAKDRVVGTGPEGQVGRVVGTGLEGQVGRVRGTGPVGPVEMFRGTGPEGQLVGDTPRPGVAVGVPADCDAADQPEVELSGEIEGEARLRCDRRYRLSFVTWLRPGATLTIDPGTTIVGDAATRGTLVVQPGARLVAEGTPERPIVFTSAAPEGQRRAGDWGGLLLLGRAPTNLRDAAGEATRGRVEGLGLGADGEYGGDDPEDSSGVLRYVRIEYSGITLGPNNEINGLTLAGVGRGTRIDHVQVRHSADDCFEFFGGTVDAHHLICEAPGDDAFDWDLGYTGRLQFLLAQGGQGHGIEGDNDPAGSRRTPISAPQIYNATLCAGAAAGERVGAQVRRGSSGTLGNLVIAGFTAGVELRDADTQLGLYGALAVDLAGPAARGGIATERVRAGTGAVGCDGVGPASELVREGVAPPEDGFFDASARYLGALRGADDRWARAGWTRWDT